MDAELAASIAEGRRRLKQFEEKSSQRLERLDGELDNRRHQLAHKYPAAGDELRAVSWPLWGVVLETGGGQRVFKEHVTFEEVAKCGRRCPCAGLRGRGPSAAPSEHIPAPDSYEPSPGYEPSAEARAIVEGRRWGVDKYLYDEQFVSNPPYGTFMRRPSPAAAAAGSGQQRDQSAKGLQAAPTSPSAATRQLAGLELPPGEPNTRLVSQYWRRKWRIPSDW